MISRPGKSIFANAYPASVSKMRLATVATEAIRAVLRNHLGSKGAFFRRLLKFTKERFLTLTCGGIFTNADDGVKAEVNIHAIGKSDNAAHATINRKTSTAPIHCSVPLGRQ